MLYCKKIMTRIKKDGGMCAAIAKKDAAFAEAYGLIEQLKSQLEGNSDTDAVNESEIRPVLEAVDDDAKKMKNYCRYR